MITLSPDQLCLFNHKIVRELLLTECNVTDEETIDKIYLKCADNPWNAPILYRILKLMDDNHG